MCIVTLLMASERSAVVATHTDSVFPLPSHHSTPYTSTTAHTITLTEAPDMMLICSLYIYHWLSDTHKNF